MTVTHADGSRLRLAGKDETACRTTWKHGETIVSWTNGRQPAVFFTIGDAVAIVIRYVGV